MKIAIIGFGTEGKALAHYFGRRGHDVTICDKENKDSAAKNQKKKHFRFGPNYLDGLDKFDMVFRSPGTPFLKKELAGARKKLTSMTKYFFDKCPCPIIGITGTKGKGTTATLICEMLKESKKPGGNGKVFFGGNIGEPSINFLDDIRLNDIVILELSSFQLQDLAESPHIAVVLGITPDHLDHHADMEEYINAKKNIVSFQKNSDFAILDADNKISKDFSRYTKAKKLFVSTNQQIEEGGFLNIKNLIVRLGETNIVVGETGRVRVTGPHNIKNILAAATVACILKIPIEIIAKVIREFPGLPHRLEFIKENAGVRYYNDSASTNPETAIAALRSFNDPTILIAGGYDKNTDFTPLGEEIAKRLNVKTVVLMGDTKTKIERATEDAVKKEDKRIEEEIIRTGRPIRRRDVPLELISADTYQEAFMVAKMLAQPGDTVLFSPASASFDMFANYQERGDTFRRFVLDMTN